MSIRRMIQWNDAKKKFIGYITYGNFKGEFIAPNGKEKAVLINQVVTEVTKLGIRVANITFDGLSSNFSACEELGASFNQLNMKPFFLIQWTQKKFIFYLMPATC